jgi:carbonic anhydrase
MDTYATLVDGYKDFRGEYLNKKNEAYDAWASKQQVPKTLIVGCSDSCVNPATLTHAGLGEIFVVNNVANIVPPYEQGNRQYMSIGAAIQHAVQHIEVEHIIVMGHSGCGGIEALMADEQSNPCCIKTDDYISEWVSILDPARDAVLANSVNAPYEEQLRLCEMEGALVSIQNLAGYPWVRDAVRDKRLTLHAWYFHIESGELLSYRPEEGCFRRLVQS